MASLTRWTWVSVNSRSWWWTGRPGMLRFMGSQRVGHDWATDLIWSRACSYHIVQCRSWPLFRLIPHRKNLSPSSSRFNPRHCSRPSLLRGKFLQSLSSGSSPLDCVQLTLLTTPSEGSPLPFHSQHLFCVSTHLLSPCSTASPPCFSEAAFQVHDHSSGLFLLNSSQCPNMIITPSQHSPTFAHMISYFLDFLSSTSGAS